MIHPDPLLLRVGDSPQRRGPELPRAAAERIFTFGSVKKGMLFETTAVPELRDQAKALAEQLASTPRNKSGLYANRGTKQAPRRKKSCSSRIAGQTITYGRETGGCRVPPQAAW